MAVHNSSDELKFQDEVLEISPKYKEVLERFLQDVVAVNDIQAFNKLLELFKLSKIKLSETEVYALGRQLFGIETVFTCEV